MPRYLALLGLGIFTLLSACNTIEGAGQDVSAGGELLTETADEAQQGM